MQLTNYSFLDSRSHYLEAQSNHKVSMQRLARGTKLERSGSNTGALSQSMRSRFEMMGDRSFITNLQNTRSFLSSQEARKEWNLLKPCENQRTTRDLRAFRMPAKQGMLENHVKTNEILRIFAHSEVPGKHDSGARS